MDPCTLEESLDPSFPLAPCCLQNKLMWFAKPLTIWPQTLASLQAKLPHTFWSSCVDLFSDLQKCLFSFSPHGFAHAVASCLGYTSPISLSGELLLTLQAMPHLPSPLRNFPGTFMTCSSLSPCSILVWALWLPFSHCYVIVLVVECTDIETRLPGSIQSPAVTTNHLYDLGQDLCSCFSPVSNGGANTYLTEC